MGGVTESSPGWTRLFARKKHNIQLLGVNASTPYLFFWNVMHRNFVVFRNVASLKKKQRKKTRKSVSGLKRQVRFSRGNKNYFLCQNGENWPIWRCRTESDEWICLIQPFPSSMPGLTDKRTALCVWFFNSFSSYGSSRRTKGWTTQREERHPALTGVISTGDRVKRTGAACPSYQDREPRDVICYWVDVKFTWMHPKRDEQQ